MRILVGLVVGGVAPLLSLWAANTIAIMNSLYSPSICDVWGYFALTWWYIGVPSGIVFGVLWTVVLFPNGVRNLRVSLVLSMLMLGVSSVLIVLSLNPEHAPVNWMFPIDGIAIALPLAWLPGTILIIGLGAIGKSVFSRPSPPPDPTTLPA